MEPRQKDYQRGAGEQCPSESASSPVRKMWEEARND